MDTQLPMLYADKNQCCGCALCTSKCPRQLIQMRPDQEGFLYPQVLRPAECTQCGRCTNVCPAGKRPAGPGGPIEAFSGHFADRDKLRASASGGLATAMSEKIIGAGGCVAGVEYAESFRTVRFAIAQTPAQLEAFKSSKYVQADKGSIYADVLARLKKRQTVLFIGLPCEVAAMTACASKYATSLYTCDLICHGPTSPQVQREFCEGLESTLGSTLTEFNVRYKHLGWKPPYVRAQGANGRVHLQSLADSDYGVAFRFLKRPACHTCRFKGAARTADITIGDYHGVPRDRAEYNPDGVSIGLVNTPRGYDLLSGLHAFVLTKTSMQAALRNRAWHTSIRPRFNRKRFSRTFAAHGLRAACALRSVRVSDRCHAARLAVRTLLSKVKRALIR